MNKTFLLLTLIFFSLTSFSQNTEEKKITIPNSNSTTFNWKNGYEEIVEVKFRNSIKEDVDNLLFYIVALTMINSELSLKNPLSFIPKKLILSKSEDGKYYAITTFYGKNTYGSEEEIDELFNFDLNGNIFDQNGKNLSEELKVWKEMNKYSDEEMLKYMFDD